MTRIPALLPVLLDGGVLGLLTKVSLLMLVAAIASLVARHASAALRHFIWVSALGGSLVLAVLSPAAPPLVLELHGPTRMAVPRPVPIAAPVAPRVVATRAGAVRVSRAPAAIAPRFVMVARRPTLLHRSASWARSHATVFVVAIWLLGLELVLVRCALGHLAFMRLVDDADPAQPRHLLALAATASELGIERDVRLLVSSTIPAPVTSGVLRPVVLVPRDADHWTDERMRVVLLHELAHVARLDYVTQLIATVACALFWFHPGVWLAAARLRSEGELAADDRVLEAGLPGVSYASHLLEIARHGRANHASAAVAVGMARASHLEGRFRAMLDSSRSRSSLSARAQLAALAAGVLVLVPVAGLRTELAAAAAAPRHQRFLAVAAPTRVAVPTVVAATAAPVAVIAHLARFDSTFERTVSAADGERLVVELPTGGAVTIQGWDEPRVELRARLGGRDWRDTRVSLERFGGGVRLRSTFDAPRREAATSHEFELRVPRRFNVQIQSAGGGIAIRDVAGEFRGHTGGGTIEIERASGVASLTTGGGEVVVIASDLVGTVSSGSGEVWSNGAGGIGTGSATTVISGVGGVAGGIGPGSVSTTISSVVGRSRSGTSGQAGTVSGTVRRVELGTIIPYNADQRGGQTTTSATTTSTNNRSVDFSVGIGTGNTPVAPFSLVLSDTLDGTGWTARCDSGCNWQGRTLAFGCPSACGAIVDANGLVTFATLRPDSTKFMFLIEHTANGGRAVSRLGTAWGTLSWTCRSTPCRVRITELGVSGE